MIHNTNIIPGEGLNGIKLGESFYSLSTQLNKFKYRMKIIYSDTQYLKTPITILLPDLGLRLLFTAFDRQELILIEAINFDTLNFSYNGISLVNLNEMPNDMMNSVSGSRSEETKSADLKKQEELVRMKVMKYPTLKQIYNKIFGPTYPGTLYIEQKKYLLSYPGIVFTFLLDDDVLENCKALNCSPSDNQILSILLNLGGHKDLCCNSLAIFSASSWESFYSNTLLKPEYKIEPNKALGHSWPVNSIRIEMVFVNLKQGLIKIVYEIWGKKELAEVIFKIGSTTQQEIFNILGPPDEYFNKFDSRLLIHNYLSNSLKLDLNDTSNYKFHNYFSHGIDFLYDLNSGSNNTGILKKVIIHNGCLTESLDFMRWNKCRWKITTGSDCPDVSFEQLDDTQIANSSMLFDEIPNEFFQKAEEVGKIRPVLLNRYEAELTDNDLDVIQYNEIGTDLLASPPRDSSNSDEKSTKLKTWGQSKLYGYKSCIWEVIDSNNCISSITIY